MSKNSTNTIIEEQQLSDGYAKKIRNKSYSDDLARWEVLGTPMTIWKTEGLYYVLVGKYRMSDAIENLEEAIKWCEEITWDKIMKLIFVITENK